MSWIGLAILGLFAGGFSGLVGISGGVIIVPALIYLFGLTQHQAQGTTLALLVPPIGLLAAWTYFKHGYVDLRIAAVVAVAFAIGALLGANISVAIPEKMLSKIFGIAMLAISLKMIFTK